MIISYPYEFTYGRTQPIKSRVNVRWLSPKEIDKEKIFDELVSNKTFLIEAKEARRQIARAPSSFTNFTQKYSDLIE